MEEQGPKFFGGLSGQVLWSAFSPASFLTGFAFAGPIGVILFVLNAGGSPELINNIIGQLLVSFGLARIAVSAMGGQLSGSIFAGLGDDIPRVVGTTLRYTLLTLLWSLPITIAIGAVASSSLEGAAAAGPMGALSAMSNGALVPLVCLLTLGTLLTPPLLLIASTASEGFGELFSTSTWGELFSGRTDELAVLYALCLGGALVPLGIGVPILLAMAVPMKGLVVLPAVLFGIWWLGVATTLLGRLCGAFINGIGDLAEPITDAPPVRLGGAGSPSVYGGGFDAPAPAGGPAFAGDAGSAGPVASAPTAPRSIPLAAPSGPPQPPGLETAGASPRANATAPAAPAAPAAPVAQESHEAGQRKPPLLDAAERCATLWRDFESDKESALRRAEELVRSYSPSPQLLHTLAVMNARAGNVERAMEVAPGAYALCRDRGNVLLAAEIYVSLRDRRSELGLGVEELLAAASSLASHGQHAHAVTTFATVIESDPSEPRAIKGLLAIADHYLHRAQDPQSAQRIFAFLAKRCPASPMSEFIDEGLRQCERKLAALAGNPS